MTDIPPRIWWVHTPCDAGPTAGTADRHPDSCAGCGRTDGEWWPGAPIVAPVADPTPPPVPAAAQPADQHARYAAEHFLEQAIADAMAAYGEANWRQDLGPALAARFRVYFDYDGPRRRLMLCGPWEEDPEANRAH